jgi:hypothetical protein
MGSIENISSFGFKVIYFYPHISNWEIHKNSQRFKQIYNSRIFKLKLMSFEFTKEFTPIIIRVEVVTNLIPKKIFSKHFLNKG